LDTSNRIVSVVDDELDITRLFRDALSNSIDDASVVTFNDPIIALEHYAKNKQSYALVIADMRMPAIDGLELLKKVKKLNPKVRTILISAYEFQKSRISKLSQRWNHKFLYRKASKNQYITSNSNR